MNGPRIGALFAGYGGLEMGIQAAYGGTVAWHSEIDPGACKILAHRYPDVPNVGDITTVDWSAVEPVDILAGGFPCQDLSLAGRQAGMKPGTRSGLWEHFAYAIDQLRPRLVVAENVRGLLNGRTAESEQVVTYGPKGGRKVGHTNRALGRVLSDLADIGYDARWYGLRAADVGACHGRFRVFVVARDTTMRGRDLLSAGATGEPTRETRGPDRATADAAGEPGDERGEPATGEAGGGGSLGLAAGRSGAHAPADADCERLEGVDIDPQGTGEPQGTARCGDGGGDQAAPVATGDRWDEGGTEPAGIVGRPHAAIGSDAVHVDWREYEPAIRRWEAILGRPAPAPTAPGRNGGPNRLSPRFEEWMMGLPEGWVTDVPGLSRQAQMKALGNGVVPQQAEAALRFLASVS